MRYQDLKNVQEVVIPHHAVSQWNDRVGPTLDAEQIKTIVEGYLREYDRIEIIGRGCMILDNEIVVACSLNTQKVLVVETCFGRISLVPFLLDHDSLSSFMHRQRKGSGLRNSQLVRNVKREGINLTQDKETLEKQIVPEFSRVVRIKILSNVFKIKFLGEGRYEIKQLTGNIGVGQVFTVEVDNLFRMYNMVVPNSLSHVHLAKLCAAVADIHAKAN
ncbi:hypothetical protein D3C78_18850 [compost metagenome]